MKSIFRLPRIFRLPCIFRRPSSVSGALFAGLFAVLAGGAQAQTMQTTLTLTGPAMLVETDVDTLSGVFTLTRTGAEFNGDRTITLTLGVDSDAATENATVSGATGSIDVTAPFRVNFPGGDQTTITFRVTVTGDNLNEDSEVFTLATSGGGSTTTHSTDTTPLAVTITDDDPIAITLSGAPDEPLDEETFASMGALGMPATQPALRLDFGAVLTRPLMVYPHFIQDGIATTTDVVAGELDLGSVWTTTGVTGTTVAQAATGNAAFTFAEGASGGYISLPFANDDANEGEEVILVQVDAGEDGRIVGGYGDATISGADTLRYVIAASDPVTVGLRPIIGTQSGGTTSLHVDVRGGITTGTIRVPYTVTGGTVDGATTGNLEYNLPSNRNLGLQISALTVAYTAGNAPKEVAVTLGTPEVVSGGIEGGVRLVDAPADRASFFVEASTAPMHTFTLGLTGGGSTADENAGDVVFVVTRTGPAITAGEDLVVEWFYRSASATEAADFAGNSVPAGGMLTFTGSETTKNFTITLADDTVDDDNENISLGLTASIEELASEGGVRLGPTFTFLINDNDATPMANDARTLAITGPASIDETDADAMSGDYTISITTGPGFTTATDITLTVGVDSDTETGDATVGADVTAPSTITFLPGETEKTFRVNIAGDNLNEDSEVFTLATSGGPDTVTTHSAALAVTIVDDDPIVITITGDGGPGVILDEETLAEMIPQVHFDLGATLTRQLDIRMAVIHDSDPATNNLQDSGTSEFNPGTSWLPSSKPFIALAQSGTAQFRFPPGISSGRLAMPFLDDELNEGQEVALLAVAGSTVRNTSITGNYGEISVVNDFYPFIIGKSDPATVSVSAVSATVDEGAPAQFTVTLSHRTEGVITVPYTVSGGGAGGSVVFDGVGVGGGSPMTRTITLPTASATSVAVTLGTPTANRMAGDVSLTADTAARTASVTVTPRSAAHVFTLSGAATITEGGATAEAYTVTRTGVAGAAAPAIADGESLVISWAYAGGNRAPVAADFMGDAFPAGGMLTFSAAETSKTFRITVANDDLNEADEDFIISLSATSGELDSEGGVRLGAPLSVGITDDPDDAITIAVSALVPATTVTEGSDNDSITYTVTLGGGVPTAEIAVPFALSGVDASRYQITQPANISSSATDFSVVFYPSSSANVPVTRSVRVDIVDNEVNEASAVLTFTPGEVTSLGAAGALAYATGSDAAATVTVDDDDSLTVEISATDDPATATEGGNARFTVSLNKRSTAAVTVPWTTNTFHSLVPASGTLTIPAGQMSGAIVIPISSTDDLGDDNAAQDLTVTLGTPEGGHRNPTLVGASMAATVSVTFRDAGVLISPLTLTVTEGTNTGTYTVALFSDPGAAAMVTITPSSADTSAVDVAGGALTFTSANWNTAQTVVVIGVMDPDTSADTVSIHHAVAGYPDVEVAASVQVTTIDNYPPRGVNISTDTLTAEEDTTVTYTVRLNTEPDVNVTVTPSSSDSDAVTVTGALTFSMTNWNTPQTVAVNAAKDGDTADASATISHRVENYGGFSTDHTVVVMVNDLDVAELVLTPASLSVDEGGSNTYTVALRTTPTADVMVTVSSGNTSVATVPADTVLTFTAANWDAAQTVTVTPAAGDITANVSTNISHMAEGGDYDGINRTLAVTVVAHAYIVEPSGPIRVSPDGESEFTIALATDPGTDLIVRFDVQSDASQGSSSGLNTNEANVNQNHEPMVTVNPTSVTFTAGRAGVGNWNTPQTVTVTTVGASGTFTITATSDAPSNANYATVGTTAVALPDISVVVSSGADARDELNRVILPEVARAIAGSQTEAIARRMRSVEESDGGGAGSFNFGGQSTLSDMAVRHAKTMADDGLDMKRMLGDSDFVLPLGAHSSGGGGGMAMWGGGDYRDFGGESGEIDWDGDMFSLHLGIDTRLNANLLAGLMVSHSDADIEYTNASDAATTVKGDYELDMTSVHPYLGWSAGRVDMWATAGYGQGDLEISDDAQPGADSTSDVNMQTIGIGGSSELLNSGGLDLRLKAEAFHTRTEVEGSEAGATDPMSQLEVDAQRLRVAVESTNTRTLASGASLTPAYEIGLRHDDGDGRTGTGAEVGGTLKYHSIGGVTLEARARALLGHSGDYEDWGIGGAFQLNPGADRQGLSIALKPGYGRTGSGVQGVWNDGVLDDANGTATPNTRDLPGMTLNARIGYGLPASAPPAFGFGGVGNGGDGVLTPYTELNLGETNQTYHLGMQWELGKTIDLNLFTRRKEKDNEAADHAVLLKGEMRF